METKPLISSEKAPKTACFVLDYDGCAGQVAYAEQLDAKQNTTKHIERYQPFIEWLNQTKAPYTQNYMVSGSARSSVACDEDNEKLYLSSSTQNPLQPAGLLSKTFPKFAKKHGLEYVDTLDPKSTDENQYKIEVARISNILESFPISFKGENERRIKQYKDGFTQKCLVLNRAIQAMAQKELKDCDFYFLDDVEPFLADFSKLFDDEVLASKIFGEQYKATVKNIQFFHYDSLNFPKTPPQKIYFNTQTQQAQRELSQPEPESESTGGYSKLFWGTTALFAIISAMGGLMIEYASPSSKLALDAHLALNVKMGNLNLNTTLSTITAMAVAALITLIVAKVLTSKTGREVISNGLSCLKGALTC